MSAEILLRAAKVLRGRSSIAEGPLIASELADLFEAEAQAHYHMGGEIKSVFDLPGTEKAPVVILAKKVLMSYDIIK